MAAGRTVQSEGLAWRGWRLGAMAMKGWSLEVGKFGAGMATSEADVKTMEEYGDL